MQKADMIIAVTRNDEINMLICQIAFSIFNVQKKIARIRSTRLFKSKIYKSIQQRKFANRCNYFT